MEQVTQQQLPIFILNLPEAKKRREFIQQQLEKHNLKGEFFKASRGDELPQEFLAKFKVQQGMPLLGREMAHSELGCIFSHYFLLKKIIAEDIPTALVLEDDAIISQDSANLLSNFPNIANIANIKDNWDLLSIGYWTKLENGRPFVGRNIYPTGLWHSKKVKPQDIHKLYELSVPNIHIGPLIDEIEGTHAYVVTKKGAQHLIRVIEQQPILPFDVFLHANKKHLRHYAITPYLIRQSKNLTLEQHIRQERHVAWANPTPNKFAQLRRLDKIKLFLLNNFGHKGHPLYWPYTIARYLWQSTLKTNRVLSRPIMRKAS